MKAVIMSDSHGLYLPMRKIFKLHHDADAFVFLGDGLEEFNTCSRIYEDKAYYKVRGNCDTLDAPIELLFELGGKKIFITHGHRYGVSSSSELLIYRARELGADAVFYGHTHLQSEENIELPGKYLPVVCPGSIAYSRGGNPSSYAVVTVAQGNILTSIVTLT